ncbi:MAG: inositol monophosphatase [Candidatus Omnitrophota bacterium]|nr:MAG: inositol monophosphatase [Candidatus Omnitrophota bacterium]
MNYIDVAIAAAKQAGTIHKKYFQTDIAIEEKSSSYDLVTVADLESEKAVVATIKYHFPEHNILAEEEKYEKTDSEFTWIIDPLDGTNNFAHGLPIFCVSIALAHKNEVMLGVIYDVMRDELFSAEKGKGALLNGKIINVTSTATLQKSLLITGFYYDRGEEMADTLDNVKRFFIKRIVGLRRLGAAALDLCYIASGRAAGFWEFELNPWDFAAGKLIVEEAGGRVTGKQGEEVGIRKKSYIVASNGRIHDQMISVLNEKV